MRRKAVTKKENKVVVFMVFPGLNAAQHDRCLSKTAARLSTGEQRSNLAIYLSVRRHADARCVGRHVT
jgi:hypothetical protein